MFVGPSSRHAADHSQVSLSETRSGCIDGAICLGLARAEYGRRSRWGALPENPYSRIGASGFTPAENHIMRISQNRSDISGLVWCVAARRARPQIADAVRIASTFDIIGIDPARFTQTADIDRATSDQGTPIPCASNSTAAVQRHEHFISCVRAADQKQTFRAGPAFAK